MRDSRRVLLGLALLGLVGCQAGIDTSQYKPYDQLPSEPVTVRQTETEPEAATASSAEAPTTADTTRTDGTPVAFGGDDVPPVSALGPVNVVDGTALAAVMQATSRSDGAQPKPQLSEVRGGSERPVSAPASPDGTAANGVVTPAQPLPGGIQLLVPHKEFRVQGPNGALRVSYDDLDLLKILNMEPVPPDAEKYFPDWLRQLDGQRIRIRGFMYPQFESTGIERFVLARDNQICCFGRDPKVYDLIEVTMAPGRTTDFILGRPFDVVGIFHIELVAEGGKPLGLYRIEDALVIDR